MFVAKRSHLFITTIFLHAYRYGCKTVYFGFAMPISSPIKMFPKLFDLKIFCYLIKNSISLGLIGSDSNKHDKILLHGWLRWGLTSQSTIFQSCRDGAIASWVINQYFRGVKCLAQGHNTAEVFLEPRTSRSGVRHSTTEPPRSPEKNSITVHLSRNMTKPTKWLCAQRRLRSAWAYAQSDQSLRCALDR